MVGRDRNSMGTMRDSDPREDPAQSHGPFCPESSLGDTQFILRPGKERLEVVAVEFGVVPRNLDNLRDEAAPWSAIQMDQNAKGVGDVALDRTVR